MTDESTRIDVKKQDGTNMMPASNTMPGTDKLIGVTPEKLHEIAGHVRSVADGLARTLMAASTLADSLQALINDMPTEAGHDTSIAVNAAETVQAPSLNEQSIPPMKASISTPSPQERTVHPPEPISLVDLRAYVAARSTPDKRPKIREALLKYGVKRLTDLQPAQYTAFKAEVDAL